MRTGVLGSPPVPTLPILFEPLFMPRVWGGRRLEAWGRELPPGETIGESWELVDREDAQSVVAAGSWAGRTLHDLWTAEREAVFGARGAASTAPRFPLLVKLLDARATMSVQVHPPASVAGELGGEPKSELWVVLEADAGAHVFLGLRRGVTRAEIEARLQAGGDVSALLHRVAIRSGDAVYVPSGRVHAIGAGCVIAEIQQNSDTTYRVYDFGRPGLDGEPRELHVDASLRSIDFADTEPALLPRGASTLVAEDVLVADRLTLGDHPQPAAPRGECAVLCALDGEMRLGASAVPPGRFVLAPAAAALTMSGSGRVLRALLPPGPR